MHALAHYDIQSEQSRNTKFFHDDAPWILLKNKHQRVNYEFTPLGTGTDEQDSDCIALAFRSKFPLQPGTQLTIGVPLPESLRDYTAEVVSSMHATSGFEISLLIKIESDMDLLTLMRSNAYLSNHYNA